MAERIDQTPGVARTEHTSALAIGTQIGRYRIAAVLGQGAFGITYRARDLQLERDVALKEYLPALLATRLDGVIVTPRSTQAADDFAWGRARFLEEARILARLGHAPAVVRVHDFLEANGTAYVVMELVEGETLAALCRREGRLPPANVERLLHPLLDGLEQVHAVGILHRDIKPENVIVRAGGVPTLIDFGASRMAMAGRTQSLTAVYTPRYAAPEQITSQPQGPYTDIYALAATLYACVNGREPAGAIDRWMAGDVLPSARESAADSYHYNLLCGIDAGLLLKADERPQTIRAWREVFATGQWPRLLSAEPTTVTKSKTPSDSAKSVTRDMSRRRSASVFGAIAAAAVLLLAATTLWWLDRDRAAPQSFEAELEAALARSTRTSAESRKSDTVSFANAKENRAIAVAPQAGKLRYTWSWPTREMAEEKALEKCQLVHDEPCALIAVNDTVLPAGTDGSWPTRDAPRVRYTGVFSLERIPAVSPGTLQRPEISSYSASPAFKAMALNAVGVITQTNGAPSQRDAEERALLGCKSEAVRGKANDACYLYAIDNRVVLPLRATVPISPAAVAPSPPSPAASLEPTMHTRLLEALARILPSEPVSTRESRVAAYESARQHKAIAGFPPSGSWHSSGLASAMAAEEHALEGCQVRYGAPCLLIVVDDVFQPADVASTLRPMPRAEYDGLFDPQQIPAVNAIVRQQPHVVGYRLAPAAKAVAFHPLASISSVTGASSQRKAEEQALAKCNAELQGNTKDGPCLLYAAGDQVVLTRRATVPIAPP
jgi:serine/threonine protein kinase